MKRGRNYLDQLDARERVRLGEGLDTSDLEPAGLGALRSSTVLTYPPSAIHPLLPPPEPGARYFNTASSTWYWYSGTEWRPYAYGFTGFRAVVRVATQGPVANLVTGAPLLVDGRVVQNGWRIAVVRQTDTTQNGIYDVVNAGTGANGDWQRSHDFNENVEIEQTALVYVQEGDKDADVLYKLLTDPPVVLGMTAILWQRVTLTDISSGCGAPLLWGNNRVGSTTATRYLTPGYADTLALTTVIQEIIPRDGVLRSLYVLQNQPAGNGNPIVYTVRVNGTPTALSVSLPSTSSIANDLVNIAPVLQGDRVDIEVTKALNVGAGGPGDVVVTAELQVAT